jgi:hypothetical protein
MELYPCPSCGFLVFEEPAGSYDICPICQWEDDAVQLMHPTLQGGANRESLAEAQARVLQKISPVQDEWEGYRRDSLWRPLTESEISKSQNEPKTGFAYFVSAGEIIAKYYWKK